MRDGFNSNFKQHMAVKWKPRKNLRDCSFIIHDFLLWWIFQHYLLKTIQECNGVVSFFTFFNPSPIVMYHRSGRQTPSRIILHFCIPLWEHDKPLISNWNTFDSVVNGRSSVLFYAVSHMFRVTSHPFRISNRTTFLWYVKSSSPRRIVGVASSGWTSGLF